jgi:hypothetical protein
MDLYLYGTITHDKKNYFLFLRQNAKTANAKVNKTKRKRALTKGRRGPSDAKHHRVKGPRQDTHHGQHSEPTKPRTTPTPLAKDYPNPTILNTKNKSNYLGCLLQFHSTCKLTHPISYNLPSLSVNT